MSDAAETFWAEKLFPLIFSEGPFKDDAVAARPNSFEPAAVREWLQEASAAYGSTPTQLAKMAGLAPSTVNRFLKGNGLNRNVTASTIGALSEAILELSITTAPIRNEYISGPMITEVELVGEISESIGVDVFEIEKARRVKFRVPVPAIYMNRPIFAIRITADAFSSAFDPGTILICIPYLSITDHLPSIPRNVIVHERRPNGTFSRVMSYTVDPQGEAWLLPRFSLGESASTHWGKVFRAVGGNFFISSLVIARYQWEVDVEANFDPAEWKWV